MKSATWFCDLGKIAGRGSGPRSSAAECNAVFAGQALAGPSRGNPGALRWIIFLCLLVLQAVAAYSQQASPPAAPSSQPPEPPLAFKLQEVGDTPVDADLKKAEDDISGNDFNSAILALSNYVKVHPDSARAHYDLGFAYFRVHQIGGSIRQLSRSLELNTANAQAHKILGLDCSSIGRYNLAEVEMQQAVQLEPNAPEIHYLFGRLYYTKQVYPLAQKEFQDAVRLNPAYMKAYASLGLVMEIFGKNEEAVKDYQTAIRLNEEQKNRWAWPYEYLSAYYNRQEQLDAAIKFAKQAIAIKPDFDLAYFQIARANQNSGHWAKCEAAVRKAIELNSRTPDYFYVLSVALRKEGKIPESEMALQSFERLHKNQLTDSERWKKAREQALQNEASRAEHP